jgi:Trk K+ transport system NAD-binding subunit
MGNLYLIVPTLITIMISMLIVRAGAIALMMTGMNFEKAKFQALSAFSGTGFTTREAERVVNNPRRRKIVATLMILGNAGIVTVIVTATSSFAMAKGPEIGLNALVFLGGILLIYIVARYTPVARLWEDFAQNRLSRMKIFEEEVTVDELLHITEGYGVVRIQLLEGSPFIGQSMADINAGLEHSFVLGMERGHEWLPRPRQNKKLIEGDYLVIYGKMEDITTHFG